MTISPTIRGAFFPRILGPALCALLGHLPARAQLINPGFEATPFTSGWNANGVLSEVGLNGSAISARLPFDTPATLGQSFAARRDFTLDFHVLVAGNATPESFRILLDSSTGNALELRGALGNALQIINNGTAYNLSSIASGISFTFPGNQLMRFRIIGRNLGTPTASYDVAWSNPGSTTLVHAAVNLTAFTNNTSSTSGTGINAIRFDRINAAAHSYRVDNIDLADGAAIPPSADYRLVQPPPPEPPKIVNISGVYPHLTTTNSNFECGIGAVVPWQGDLWAVTYSPHTPTGSNDKLYQISPSLEMTIRPESIGGTPANRFIHTPSNQLIIGPHFIDAQKNVRTIPYSLAPGRHTAVASHLTDPNNRVYIFTMEDGLYDVNVNDLSFITRYPDVQGSGDLALFGYHGKGAYTGGNRLIVANNGRTNDQNNPEGPSGVLASWDGSVKGPGDPNPDRMTGWTEHYQVQHCEVTGPGGIYGNSSSSDPVWTTGFDAKSVLLQTYENGVWNTWRLPKSSRTHDASHGWFTEWPRIREIAPNKMLMHMHGMFYDFPKTFSLNNFSGLSPICSYYKMPVDYCGWEGKLVISKNDSSKYNGTIVQRAQSNFWFGQPEDLKQWGAPQGHGTLWRDEALTAGQISDPFLINGFTNGTIHLRNDGATSLPIEIQISNGNNGWQTYSNLTLAPNSYRFEKLETIPAAWLRFIAGAASTKATATIILSTPYSHTTPASAATNQFAALADIRDDRLISDGLIRVMSGTDLKLEFASKHIAANGSSTTTGYQQIGGEMELDSLTDSSAEATLRSAIPTTQDFGSDAASAWVTTGSEKLRLPKIDALYDTAFASGWPRGFREAVTERYLLNCHGTFYEVPGDAAGGRRKLQPITTHGKRITDFASWRGLLALTGVLDSAPASDSLIKSSDGNSALWLGEIDDIWRMGEPRGIGGPWLNTTVSANSPSDAYLMYGYRSKSLRLSHQSASPVTFTVQVDFLANNTWSTYSTFTVAPGETLTHIFPDPYSAHWVRVSSNAATTATAQFTYGPAAARDRFLDWARDSNLPTGAGRAAVAKNDDDRDGSLALMEYVLGTDAKKSGPTPLAVSPPIFETLIRSNLAADSIDCIFETSTTLDHWIPRPDLFAPSPDQSGVPLGFVRMRAAVDPSGDIRFFRLRATCP